MKRIAIIALSVFMALQSISVSAWGPVGHDVVAAIAQQHLTKKAQKEIDKLLEGKSIVYYSSWMDNIQNSPYWKNGYNATKTWHYANVDKGMTYDSMQKNPNGDVVTALETLTDAMKNHYKELTDSMKVDYLKMIVHMVGDMHCPMHAGRSTDRGGNRVKVLYFNRETNLHSIWDSSLVESAHNWSYSEWQFQIDRCADAFVQQVQQGTPEEWFMQTVAIAKKIYFRSSGNTVRRGSSSGQERKQRKPSVRQMSYAGGERKRN